MYQHSWLNFRLLLQWISLLFFFFSLDLWNVYSLTAASFVFVSTIRSPCRGQSSRLRRYSTSTSLVKGIIHSPYRRGSREGSILYFLFSPSLSLRHTSCANTLAFFSTLFLSVSSTRSNVKSFIRASLSCNVRFTHIRR